MPRIQGKSISMADLKKISVQNTSQRIKYINSCVQYMINSLPRKIYTGYPPMFHKTGGVGAGGNMDNDADVDDGKMNKPKKGNHIQPPPQTPQTPQTLVTHAFTQTQQTQQTHMHEHGPNQPVVLKAHFFADFPVHEHVLIKCAFCDNTINPQREDTLKTFEQPQSRRRWTPMCVQCYKQ